MLKLAQTLIEQWTIHGSHSLQADLLLHAFLFKFSLSRSGRQCSISAVLVNALKPHRFCRPPEEAIEASDQQALIAPHIQDDFKDVNEEELQDTTIQNVEALKVSHLQDRIRCILLSSLEIHLTILLPEHANACFYKKAAVNSFSCLAYEDLLI